MNRRLVIVLGVVAVAVAAWAVFRRHAARRPLEWSGTVEARTVEVGSRVGGRVQTVPVREGQQVHAGEVLLVLEPGELPGLRLQVQGELEQAEAALQKVSTSAGVPSARRGEIAAATARAQASEVVLAKAARDLQRVRKMFDGGAATRADLDAASSAFKNATALRDAQKSQLDQLLRGTPQDVKAAEGRVQAVRGTLQQIDQRIDELTVKAPADARIESLELRPGDILPPNAIAARLLEPGELFVRVYVPETQLGYVQPGMSLPISVDSFPKRTFRGVVEYVSGEGEFTPRNLQTADERANQVFATRVRIDEGADVLREGMAALVKVKR